MGEYPRELAFISERMNAVNDFWFEMLSADAFTVLNREWPHWSGVQPASPINHYYHHQYKILKLHHALIYIYTLKLQQGNNLEN